RRIGADQVPERVEFGFQAGLAHPFGGQLHRGFQRRRAVAAGDAALHLGECGQLIGAGHQLVGKVVEGHESGAPGVAANESRDEHRRNGAERQGVAGEFRFARHPLPATVIGASTGTVASVASALVCGFCDSRVTAKVHSPGVHPSSGMYRCSMTVSPGWSVPALARTQSSPASPSRGTLSRTRTPSIGASRFVTVTDTAANWTSSAAGIGLTCAVVISSGASAATSFTPSARSVESTPGRWS